MNENTKNIMTHPVAIMIYAVIWCLCVMEYWSLNKHFAYQVEVPYTRDDNKTVVYPPTGLNGRNGYFVVENHQNNKTCIHKEVREEEKLNLAEIVLRARQHRTVPEAYYEAPLKCEEGTFLTQEKHIFGLYTTQTKKFVSEFKFEEEN